MASGYVPNITVELKWKGQVLKHKFSGNSTVGEVKQHAIDAFDLESSSIKLLGLGKGKAIADNVCPFCLCFSRKLSKHHLVAVSFQATLKSLGLASSQGSHSVLVVGTRRSEAAAFTELEQAVSAKEVEAQLLKKREEEILAAKRAAQARQVELQDALVVDSYSRTGSAGTPGSVALRLQYRSSAGDALLDSAVAQPSVVLPSSALQQCTAAEVPFPILFRLEKVLSLARPNSDAMDTDIADSAFPVESCYAGVASFEGSHGTVQISAEIARKLALQDGDVISLKTVTLPKCTHVRYLSNG